MKTLLLMRHAKSSWEDIFCPDHDRPLSKRGRKNAPDMGRVLAGKGLMPEYVLLSTATRVQETWLLLNSTLGADPVLQSDRSLYGTSAFALLNRIQRTDDSHGTLLVINHEPTLGVLCRTLAKDPVVSNSARAFTKFSTAGIAEFHFDADHWQNIAPGRGTFTDFTIPKDL